MFPGSGPGLQDSFNSCMTINKSTLYEIYSPLYKQVLLLAMNSIIFLDIVPLNLEGRCRRRKGGFCEFHWTPSFIDVNERVKKNSANLTRAPSTSDSKPTESNGTTWICTFQKTSTRFLCNWTLKYRRFKFWDCIPICKNYLYPSSQKPSNVRSLLCQNNNSSVALQQSAVSNRSRLINVWLSVWSTSRSCQWLPIQFGFNYKLN